MSTFVASDGVVVDLTEPEVVDAPEVMTVAGRQPGFLRPSDTLRVSATFADPESAVARVEAAVFRHVGAGIDTHIWPSDSEWGPLAEPMAVALVSGSSYFAKVRATNGAGSAVHTSTDVFWVDGTAPSQPVVVLGVASVRDAPTYTNQAYRQINTDNILAAWEAHDDVSGIVAYYVGVGPQTNVVTNWFAMGKQTSGVLTGLQLQLGQQYYVQVVAENAVGLNSTAGRPSVPVLVVDADMAGLVLDGPDAGSDANATGDAHAVTATFYGFASAQHGLELLEYAVSSSDAQIDNVVPFTTVGLVTNKTDLLGGSGTIHMPLDMVPGVKYRVTVRAVTGGGDVLTTTSDGQFVDVSPPNISDFVLDAATPLGLWFTAAATTGAAWRAADNESGVQTTLVAWGSYPGGDNLRPWTAAAATSAQPDIPLPQDGTPLYVSVTSTNGVGLPSKAFRHVVADGSDPLQSTDLRCPAFLALDTTHLRCSWSAPPRDTESGLVGMTFYLAAGPAPDNTSAATVAGVASVVAHPADQGLELVLTPPLDQPVYFGVLQATNLVGRTSVLYSPPIRVDATPPVPGAVVELSTDVRLDPVVSDRAQLLALDLSCQRDTSAVRVAWTKFNDPESGLAEYHVALGTAPGLTDLSDGWRRVPVTQTHWTIPGLAMLAGQRVFATVHGTNGAGLTTAATSDGVTIFAPQAHLSVSSSLEGAAGPAVQTSTQVISTRVVLSADACPLEHLEWALYRLDGLLVVPWQPVDVTLAVADGTGNHTGDTPVTLTWDGDALVLTAAGLTLQPEYLYYSVVNVHHDDETWLRARAPGVVVVEQAPPVPGAVYDGSFPDADVQLSIDTLTVLWEPFRPAAGPDESLVVLYYEVTITNAQTTVASFAPIRPNASELTADGLMQHIFTGLRLEPMNMTYVATVRAHTVAGAAVAAVSDGILAGFVPVVTPGFVQLPAAQQASGALLSVFWHGFELPVVPLEYAVAVVRVSGPHDGPRQWPSCTDALAAWPTLERAPDVAQAGRAGALVTGLSLAHGAWYAALVLARSSVGHAACAAALSAPVLIDQTPPDGGQVVLTSTATPAGWTLVFLRDDEPAAVAWSGFEDAESAVVEYRVQLWKDAEPIFTVLLPSTSSSFQFDAVLPTTDGTYKASVEARNGVNLWSPLRFSLPAVLPADPLTAGRVNDGLLVDHDLAFQEDRASASGVFTWAAEPSVVACAPVTSVDVGQDAAALWTTWPVLQLADDSALALPDLLTPSLLRRSAEGTTWRVVPRRDRAGLETAVVTHVLAGAALGGHVSLTLQSQPSSPLAPDLGLAVWLSANPVPSVTSAVARTRAVLAMAVAQLLQANGDRRVAGFEYYGRNNSAWDPFAKNMTKNTRLTSAEVAARAAKVSAKVVESDEEATEPPPAMVVGVAFVPRLVAADEGPVLMAWLEVHGRVADIVTIPLVSTATPLNISLRMERVLVDVDNEDAPEQVALVVDLNGEPRAELVGNAGLPNSLTVAAAPMQVFPGRRYSVASGTATSVFTLARLAYQWNALPAQQQCGPGAVFVAGTAPIARFEAAVGTTPGASDLAAWTVVQHPCLACPDPRTAALCASNVCTDPSPRPVQFSLPVSTNGTALTAVEGLALPLAPAVPLSQVQPGELLIIGYVQPPGAAAGTRELREVVWVPLVDVEITANTTGLSVTSTNGGGFSHIMPPATGIVVAGQVVTGAVMPPMVLASSACGFVVHAAAHPTAVVGCSGPNVTRAPWANATRLAYTRGPAAGVARALAQAVAQPYHWQYGVADFDPLTELPREFLVGGRTRAVNATGLAPTWYTSVCAVDLAGRRVLTSSSGVVVDVTAPVLDYVYYFQPDGPPDRPVRLQASRRAIGVAWLFQDTESGIVSVRLRVGSQPGGSDVVGDTDLGASVLARVSGLTLLTGREYYATVTACNGAGLCTAAGPAVGLRVAADAPDTSAAAVHTAGEQQVVPGQVVPLLRVEAVDVLSIRWYNIRGDFEQIDWTVGTELDGSDVLAPTVVGPVEAVEGTNSTRPSGTGWAEVRAHRLFVGTGDEDTVGRYVADVSELASMEAQDPRIQQQALEAEGQSQTEFRLEPGTCLFHRIRAFSPSQVAATLRALVCIMENRDVVVSSLEADDLRFNITASGVSAPQQRQRRTEPSAGDELPAVHVTVTRPPGANTSLNGTTMLAGVLTAAELQAEYHALPSDGYRLYLRDPATTLVALGSRSLRGRKPQYAGLSFYLNLPYVGGLQVNLKAQFDPAAVDGAARLPVVLFFDLVAEQWRLLDDSCGQPATEAPPAVVEVGVCRTHGAMGRIFNATTPDAGFLESRTQFALAVVDRAFVNTAPRVLEPAAGPWTLDAVGRVRVPLAYTDAEGDTALLAIVQGPSVGQAFMLESNVLAYERAECRRVLCAPFTVQVTVQATEMPQHEGPPLASTPPAVLTLALQPANEPPELWVNESNSWQPAPWAGTLPPVVAGGAGVALPQLAATDMAWDAVELMCAASHGRVDVADSAATAGLSVAANQTARAWTADFEPAADFVGQVQLVCTARDSGGLQSLVVQLSVEVQSPCLNGGTWQASRGACQCPSQFTGPTCGLVVTTTTTTTTTMAPGVPSGSGGGIPVVVAVGAAVGVVVAIALLVLAVRWRRARRGSHRVPKVQATVANEDFWRMDPLAGMDSSLSSFHSVPHLDMHPLPNPDVYETTV